MHRLKTIAQYKIIIVSFKSYCKKIIVIQSLNIHSLKLHFQDILSNFNFFASHLFCLNETKIPNIQTHQEIYYIISNKFKILSCYDQHGTMILYNKNMLLSHTFSKKKNVLNFFIGFFNKNTQKALYIIAIYKPP
jgi:DNA polymerase III psi subunit